MPNKVLTSLYNFKLSPNTASAIAIIFHAIGLIGILLGNQSFFAGLTALNLLLMFFLIVFTQEQRNRFFFLFIVISFIIGLVSEIIGTNTGLLFGSYAYSSILGLALKKVPLIIGVNWFVVVYCCGVSMKTMQDKLNTKFPEASISSKRNLKRLSLILDGALLAVLFDWQMEPVAIKLGYWSWTGDIPFYNYCCWFLLSSLLLWLFDMLPFTKRNKFAVHLLLIQSMFFLLLRSFL